MDQGCTAVTIYEDDIEEYLVFLTPECTKCLQKYFKEREFYGEKIIPETPIFRTAYNKKIAETNVKPISYEALKQSMYDIIQRAKIRKKLADSGMRHQKSMFNGFRKWFETTLNNINEINSNVTEKLMGHRNDLRGTYYNPDIKVRFENFEKAIPALTIDDKERLRIQNEVKQLEITELQMKERANEKLIDDLEILKLKVERIEQSKEKNS